MDRVTLPMVSPVSVFLSERVASELQEEAIVERTPVLDGKRMIMVLAPTKQQVKPERKPAEESLDAEVKNA